MESGSFEEADPSLMCVVQLEKYPSAHVTDNVGHM